MVRIITWRLSVTLEADSLSDRKTLERAVGASLGILLESLRSVLRKAVLHGRTQKSFYHFLCLMIPKLWLWCLRLTSHSLRIIIVQV